MHNGFIVSISMIYGGLKLNFFNKNNDYLLLHYFLTDHVFIHLNFIYVITIIFNIFL